MFQKIPKNLPKPHKFSTGATGNEGEQISNEGGVFLLQQLSFFQEAFCFFTLVFFSPPSAAAFRCVDFSAPLIFVF